MDVSRGPAAHWVREYRGATSVLGRLRQPQACATWGSLKKWGLTDADAVDLVRTMLRALDSFIEKPKASARPAARKAAAHLIKLRRLLRSSELSEYFGEAARLTLVQPPPPLPTPPGANPDWRVLAYSYQMPDPLALPDKPTFEQVLKKLDEYLWEVVDREPPLKGARGKQAKSLHVAKAIVDCWPASCADASPYSAATELANSAVGDAYVDARSLRGYCERVWALEDRQWAAEQGARTE